MVASKAGRLIVIKYLVDKGALIKAETINGVSLRKNLRPFYKRTEEKFCLILSI